MKLQNKIDSCKIHSNEKLKLPAEKIIQDNQTLLIPDDSSLPLKLTKEKIGKRSWEILHSIAANYPLNPTKEDQDNVNLLLNSMSKLYPCTLCGSHFQQMLKDYPIQSQSRQDLSIYICNLHNDVNSRLKKPKFNCDNVVSYYRNKENTGIKISEKNLGKISWSLLHSIAAAYPKTNAQDQDKNNLHDFLHSFAYLYPYPKHGVYFNKLIEKNKIQSSSREDVVFYLCRIHNNINSILKKRNV